MAKRRPMKRVRMTRSGVTHTKRGTGVSGGGRYRPTTKTQQKDPALKPHPRKKRVKK